MPDLSDLLKDSIGDVPPFDPAAMVSRQQHRRRVQVIGVTTTVLVIGFGAAAWATASNDNGVVVGTRHPASSDTTSDESTTTTLGDSTTTTGVKGPGGTTVTTSPPTTTTPSGPSAPQADDFTGTLTVSATTVQVGGSGIEIDLRLHNVSGHAVDTSQNATPTTLALYCEPQMNSEPDRAGALMGSPTWYMATPTMQPGADAALMVHLDPTADMVGRMGCQAVVVNQSTLPRFFPEWHAVTAIPAATFTVIAENAPITVPTTAEPATTTT